MRRLLLLLSVFLFSLPLHGCDSSQSPLNNSVVKKELLLYCGTAMAPAMREIADNFEQRHGCIVKIISDGSGALFRSLHINQVGDLYLPGSASYIEKCLADGSVVEAHQVGVNRAVLMVAKNNPLRITADLANFTNGNYRTVLGVPESGAIGQETERIFSRQGLYARALGQAQVLARDSKDINQALVQNHVDLALNWYGAGLKIATSVSLLPLPPSVADRHVLRLGLLKSSYHPQLAQQFINFSLAPEQQQLFARHGFEDD